MMLPNQPSKETTHLKKFFRHRRAHIAQSNKMTWFTDHLHYHLSPPPPAEVYKDNTNPDINYINNNNIHNSDNNYNTSNNESSVRPRLVLRLKISKVQTAPKGTRHCKRGQRAAAAVTAGRGRDGRGCGRIERKDKHAPPILEFDYSDGVMDQDDLDQDQDSESYSDSTTSSSSSSHSPSTLNETEQTAAMPLRRSTRVSKKTRVYSKSQEHEHEHLMRRSEDADGRRRDGSKSSESEVEHAEYFVLPGEYDPDHPEGYYHYHKQQQQQHNTDDDDRSGEQGSGEVTPTFWIAPSPCSTRSVSPSQSRSAMPSSSYFPSLGLEMRSGDGEREDGSGYAGDDDTNSVDEDDCKVNDESVIAVMPCFLPMSSALNENSDNYSASSTQFFPPMPGMLNNDYINNSMDGDGDDDNTTTVVDDDRLPSQTETATIAVTSGNNNNDEDDNSLERRSIADQMAIWGCVKYLDLEGRWDQVAVALGLESCPRIWEWLEREYYRLRALKESDGDE